MKKVLVSFIQDRSGSMSDVWVETVNGFRTYVNDLKADQQKDNEVEYLFSLTTFDTQIDTPYTGEAITKVDADILPKYGPRGGTALYDAVGKTLQALDDNKGLTFDKAIVVIVTDGQENSSREWSKDALHAAIDERIKRGNWTFTYLGTQPETWADASALGMGAGSSALYNAANAGATYSTMAAASANMARSAVASSRAFMAENTTRGMRMAVGLKTQEDAEDDLAGIGIGVTIPTSVRVTPKASVPQKPKKSTKSAKASGRKWK